MKINTVTSATLSQGPALDRTSRAQAAAVNADFALTAPTTDRSQTNQGLTINDKDLRKED